LIFQKKSEHRLPWTIDVGVRQMATGLDLDVAHDLQQQIKTVVTLTLTYIKTKEGKEDQWDQYKQMVPTMMLVKYCVRRS
jgi:hypothetical protein